MKILTVNDDMFALLLPGEEECSQGDWLSFKFKKILKHAVEDLLFTILNSFNLIQQFI